MSLNAFILAAGFGKRLRPITDVMPKPLLPVVGRPIIEYVFDSILDLPVDKMGVNLHYLGEQIQGWVAGTAYNDISTFFPETEILGTGGALFNARDFLKGKTFIAHNSDIIADIELLDMLEYHQKHNNMITLTIDKNGRENHVGIDNNGMLMSIKENGQKNRATQSVTFTGIAIYEPGFLGFLPSGVSHVTDSWLKAVAAGERVGTFDITGNYWSDLGTIESYSEAIARELALRQESRFINHQVFIPIECELKGLMVIEDKASIGMGVRLNNCIVLPEGNVKSGENGNNKLYYKGGELPLKAFKPVSAKFKDEEILSGGSNRVYSHIPLADDLYGIMLKTSPDDPDFERQITYTRFFQGHGIPVPHILYCDERRHRVMFSDLGKKDLYTWFHENKAPEGVTKMYKTVIDVLVCFQATDPSDCKELKSWIFDKETLLWETRYFLERFVKGYLNLSVRNEGRLEEEFSELANHVDQYPKRIMHRDFQSRNIMLNEGGVHLIDYQGARMGPPAYDFVSVVFDPYCALTESVENILYRYYLDKLPLAATYDTAVLGESILYCGLQRHMQALGAYGFLTRIKGKAWFESHIKRAVWLLKRETDRIDDEFPVLSNLVDEIAIKTGAT